MKVLTKVVMMALVIGAMNPILAKENNLLEPRVSMQELEQGKVQLTYVGEAPEKLYVQIFDQRNHRIFKETINAKSGVRKPYNISRLPYGEYQFRVKVAGKLIVHNVTHKAPMNPDMVKLIAVPLDNSKIRMMVVGSEFKDFKLSIYDDRSNKLLFEENISQSDNVGRIFNLKATGARSVNLILSHKKNVVQNKTIRL